MQPLVDCWGVDFLCFLCGWCGVLWGVVWWLFGGCLVVFVCGFVGLDFLCVGLLRLSRDCPGFVCGCFCFYIVFALEVSMLWLKWQPLIFFYSVFLLLVFLYYCVGGEWCLIILFYISLSRMLLMFYYLVFMCNPTPRSRAYYFSFSYIIVHLKK